MGELRHGRTCVFNINYHIVWSTKYRRKVLTSEIETRLKDILVNVAQEKGFEIAEIEVGTKDHAHVFVSAIPKISISYIAKMMKEAGISPVSQKEEEGALFLLYRYDNTSFSVEWQDDTMTFLMVDDPLCFVPIWYLLAGNAAD